MKDRKFWAKFIAVLFGFLTLLFWIFYLVLSTESMLSVSSLPMFGDFSLNLPFEISRWWDIPALALIVYVYVLQKKDSIGLTLFLIIFFGEIVVLISFNYAIFFPLLAAEIGLSAAFSLGLTKEELKNIKPISKITIKEVFGIVSKQFLIITWIGLSISVGIFYGFTIGAILALASTLSIWAFALVIIFGRKNLKLFLQTLFGTLLMIGISVLFVSGNILGNITYTFIAGGVCIILAIILLILKPNIFKKKKVS